MSLIVSNFLRLLIVSTFVTSCDSANYGTSIQFTNDNRHTNLKLLKISVEHPVKLFLTVSPSTGHIQVSWFNIKPTPNSVIIITDRPPTGRFQFVKNKWRYCRSDARSTQKSIRYWTIHVAEISGHITTKMPFNIDLRKIFTHTKCYGYWAVLLSRTNHHRQSSKLVSREAATCLRTHSTWMNDNRPQLGQLSFRELFVVGTHNSGAYPNSSPLYLRMLAYVATLGLWYLVENRIDAYSVNQDDDIRQQLIHGVRYLDIRIGYFSHRGHDEFKVVHGRSNQKPLRLVLKQVRDFVSETNEIVIFDIQEFPYGFKTIETHMKLMTLIESEIGDLMVDPKLTWNANLDEIWNTKRNIIVSYDDFGVINKLSAHLWPSVQQRWGNVQTLDDLRSYLSTAARQSNGIRPIADMAELTMTLSSIITLTHTDLRQMAELTNPEISKWYFMEWGLIANIVAVDFVRSTSLMETSLYWNIIRASFKEKSRVTHFYTENRL